MKEDKKEYFICQYSVFYGGYENEKKTGQKKVYKSRVKLARVRYKQSCPTVYLCTSIWVCPRAEKIKASLGRIRATTGSVKANCIF